MRLILLAILLSAATSAFAQVPSGSLPAPAEPAPGSAQTVQPKPATAIAAVSPATDYTTWELRTLAAPPHSPFPALAPNWATLPDEQKVQAIRQWMSTDPNAWRDPNGNLPPAHYLALGMNPTDRKTVNDFLLFQQEKRSRVELAQLLVLIMQSEKTIAFYEQRTPSQMALIQKYLADTHQPNDEAAVQRELDKRILAEKALLEDRRLTFQLKTLEYAAFRGTFQEEPAAPLAESLNGLPTGLESQPH